MPLNIDPSTSADDPACLGEAEFPPNLFEGEDAAARHATASAITLIDNKRNSFLQHSNAALALGESEARFRSAFDHAAIGMALVGLDGRWLQVNHSLCDIVGYSALELLATTFQAITHPDDLQTDLDYVRRLVRGDIRQYQMHKRYFHKVGRIVWVLLSVSLVRDGDHRPLYFISQIQDITSKKAVEDALAASEEDYRATFEMAGFGIAHTDLRTGRFLRVNRKLTQITGYSAAELAEMNFMQITHPEDLAQSLAVADDLVTKKISDLSYEKRYIRKDGKIIWVNVSVTFLGGSNGNLPHSVTMFEDITARKHAEWLEVDRREVLELVAQDRPLCEVLDRLVKLIGRQTEDCRAAVLWVEDGQILFHAPNLAMGFIASMKSRLLPLASALAEGAWGGRLNIGITNLQTDSMWRDIEQDPADRFEICWTLPIRSNDGVPLGIITVFTRRSSGPGDVEAQILAMASRLTTISIEHHQTTRQLSHLVRHDSLTGLPNRILFEDRLQQAMMLAHRNSKEIAMLVLDLDHFKSINDTHGHQTGDALLQQFAYRMQRKLRDTDTLARVGGDEFLILLPEISGIEGAKYVAGRLVEALIEPFRIGEHELRVTTSIGIAIYPQDGQDCMTLHHRADAAMYRAKQDGRNAFAV